MSRRQRGRIPGAWLLGVVLVAAAATPGASADRHGLTGACYCRAAGELRCVAGLGEQECNRRCTEELCDDWFWLERRPCWNWGYGG